MLSGHHCLYYMGPMGPMGPMIQRAGQIDITGIEFLLVQLDLCLTCEAQKSSLGCGRMMKHDLGKSVDVSCAARRMIRVSTSTAHSHVTAYYQAAFSRNRIITWRSLRYAIFFALMQK